MYKWLPLHLKSKHSLSQFVREQSFTGLISLEDYKYHFSEEMNVWILSVPFQNLIFYAILSAIFTRGEDETMEHHFVYPSQIIIQNDEFELQQMFDFFEDAIEQIELLGSGWTIQNVSKIVLHAIDFRPLKAGCHVKLPRNY